MTDATAETARLLKVTEAICLRVGEVEQRRCDLQLTDVPSHLQAFVDRHAGRDLRKLNLRLV
jgi:hypothetical protein